MRRYDWECEGFTSQSPVLMLLLPLLLLLCIFSAFAMDLV